MHTKTIAMIERSRGAHTDLALSNFLPLDLTYGLA